jgi:hypothetical protein
MPRSCGGEEDAQILDERKPLEERPSVTKPRKR